jgi:hypothetical protein
MHALHPSSQPKPASIVTIDAALDGRSCPPNPSSGATSSLRTPHVEASSEAAPRGVAGVALTDEHSVVDGLLSRMIGAGHGVAALSLYLGIGEAKVRDRVRELGLPPPIEKKLRRVVAANPWLVEHVRRLIALWLDNAAAGSIGETLGRSSSSIHGKRRWLGLGVRNRKGVAKRPVAECARVPLPWRPMLDVSGSEIWLGAQGAAQSTRTPDAKTPTRVASPEPIEWELGRDREKDERFSVLGFAGLRSETIAERMQIEFGVRLTKKAVDNRISRLQIVRDRHDLMDDYDAKIVEQRASRAKAHFGATLRQCQELHRSFWWCRKIGGALNTCREFQTAKFRSRRSERSSRSVMAMA